MNKYSKLFEYIINENKEKLILSFSEIESILGFKLDHSFLTYKKELINNGFDIKISLKNETMTILKHHLFYLKKLEDDDINIVSTWLDLEHVKPWFTHKDAWINEIIKRDNEFNFIHHYIVMDNNVKVGFMQYYDYLSGKETWYNNPNLEGIYSIDYLIGFTNYLHKGYSKTFINLLELELRKEKDLKRIIVKPEKENYKSRKALINANYLYDELNDYFYKDL